MAKKTLSSGSGEADFHQTYELSRRSLLRLTLTGGAMLLGPIPFAAAQGATSGASETPQTGGTLTIGADADPIGLDPTTVTAFSSFDFSGLIYTGLLRWNAEMKIEPDLAVSYERPDRDDLCLQASPGSEVSQRPGLHRGGRQVHLRPDSRSRQPRAGCGPSIRASRP